MEWSLEAVLAATSGRLLAGAGGPPGRVRFTAVGTDSRSLPRAALFVPLRAGRDGHDFVASAVAAGAAGYLVEAGHPLGRALPPGVAVEVADTGAALLDLGRAARRRLDVPLVGITGSVGKTSTKDLTAGVLARRWRVAASPRSFNNEIGVPLSLANAPHGTQIVVIEMGARGPGHIALLCDVARPTIAVVTSVAAVHTELFGSIDAVAAAKAELVDAVPDGGTAVLNADDPRVAAMAGRTRARLVRYSASGRGSGNGSRRADVVAEGVEVGPDLRARFRLASPWGGGPVRLEARGAHQVANALAAAAVGFCCGVEADDVRAGLQEAALSPWRMELVTAASGATVVNDAYNANPTSMAAALRALASLAARRRRAVLGPMAELGAEGPAEHLAVAALAAELGIEVLALGTDAYGVVALDGVADVLAALGPLDAGDAVLVKGSRAAGLERLVAALLER